MSCCSLQSWDPGLIQRLALPVGQTMCSGSAARCPRGRHRCLWEAVAVPKGSGLARGLGKTTVGDLERREDAIRRALDACAGGFDRGDRIVTATRPPRDVAKAPLASVDAQGVTDY